MQATLSFRVDKLILAWKSIFEIQVFASTQTLNTSFRGKVPPPLFSLECYRLKWKSVKNIKKIFKNHTCKRLAWLKIEINTFTRHRHQLEILIYLKHEALSGPYIQKCLKWKYFRDIYTNIIQTYINVCMNLHEISMLDRPIQT